MARFSLSEARDRVPRIDAAKLDATTEEDIRRYQIADGMEPHHVPAAVEVILSPREVRAALGMTQREFAAALQLPDATVRNWEQGRTQPDAPARALLKAVSREADAVLRALGSPVSRQGPSDP